MNNKEYDEFALKYDISKYAIRIEINHVGTGFLWGYQKSDYVYVFTAFHIMVDIVRAEQRKKILLEYQRKQITIFKEEVEYCTLFDKDFSICSADDNIELSEEERKMWSKGDCKASSKDIAVLRILKSKFSENIEFPEPLLWLKGEKIISKNLYVGFGYPNEEHIQEPLYGKCQEWNKEDGLLICKAENISHKPFEEAMRGFSGTGLVADYDGKAVWVGIVVHCKTDEMYQKFNAVGIEDIIDRMNRIGWEIPMEYGNGEVPEGFGCDKIQDLDKKYFQYMGAQMHDDICCKFYEISQELSPRELEKMEKFYDIPQCLAERKSCSYYWVGKKWLLCIQEILNGDKQLAKFVIQEKEIPLEYVCTEGDGKATLASVVKMAIKNKVWGEDLKEDCIVIWQSKENPDTTELQRSQFKNVVKNILSDGVEKKRGMDLLYGEHREKNYGIIHLNELIKGLNKCKTCNDAKKKMEEILNEIWK